MIFCTIYLIDFAISYQALPEIEHGFVWIPKRNNTYRWAFSIRLDTLNLNEKPTTFIKELKFDLHYKIKCMNVDKNKTNSNINVHFK